MISAVAGPVYQGPLDTFNGLPTHPLVIHAALGLVALSAVGGVLSLIPRWRGWMLPATAVAGVLAALSAIVATETGESLEHRLPASELIEEHAAAGERTRTIALILAVLLIAWWAVDRAMRRRSAARPAEYVAEGAPLGMGGTATATATATAPSATAVTRTAPAGLRIASLMLGIVTALVALLSAVLLYLTGDQGAKAVWGDMPAASSSQSASSGS